MPEASGRRPPALGTCLCALEEPCTCKVSLVAAVLGPGSTPEPGCTPVYPVAARLTAQAGPGTALGTCAEGAALPNAIADETTLPRGPGQQMP